MMRKIVLVVGLLCLASQCEGRLQLAIERDLIDLVQRLHSELGAKFDKLNNDWNDKFDKLNKDWNDKFDMLKTDVSDKLDKISNEWSDKSDRVQINLSDKLDKINNEWSDKSDRVQINLSDKLDKVLNDSGDKLDKVQTELSVKFTKLLRDKNDQFDKVQHNWNDTLQRIEDKVASFEKYSGHNFNRLEDTFTRLIEDKALSTETTLKNNISEGLSLLQGRLETSIQELPVNINKTASETRTAVGNIVSRMDILSLNDVKSAVRDLLNPRSCKKGVVSVLHEASYPYSVIYPSEDDTPNVPYLCDTLTDGGGWIIIQRRTTGDVDFYRGWADYKKGFGTIDSDFWLGNNNIHSITSQGTYELRVDLKYQGKSVFAHYVTFAVADEQNNYALSVGLYDGTAGNSLGYHNGRPFTTRDRDNDDAPHNCAVTSTGAWWYGACHHSNLNGKWKEGGDKGPVWRHFTNTDPMSYSEMKIRRVDN